MRPSFALGMWAAAINVGPFLQRFTLSTAILFGGHAGTDRMLALLSFFSVHSILPKY
jgi:hypothetical protein